MYPCNKEECPLLSISLLPLTNGKYSIVDTSSYEQLGQWNWHIHKGKNFILYARRNAWNKVTKRAESGKYLHREVLMVSPEMQIDHINSNGLDNRKCNLRVCASSQNNMNQRKRCIATSFYKGVCWNKRANKWYAQICCNKTPFYLGLFVSQRDAALAYNTKAKELFGEFARLNKVK